MRTARNYGLDVSGWTLHEGSQRQGMPRVSYEIHDAHGTALIALGYTRRTAFDALSTMSETIDLLINLS
jgi:hypothetical protein